jgi:hypothetical protein
MYTRARISSTAPPVASAMGGVAVRCAFRHAFNIRPFVIRHFSREFVLRSHSFYADTGSLYAFPTVTYADRISSYSNAVATSANRTASYSHAVAPYAGQVAPYSIPIATYAHATAICSFRAASYAQPSAPIPVGDEFGDWQEVYFSSPAFETQLQIITSSSPPPAPSALAVATATRPFAP